MKKDNSTKTAVLLKGVISNLQRSKRSHDFVLTEVQHRQVGATAIAASALGAGAAAIGLIGMAGNSDEEADWVEFELDGKQIKGWLWMMPMRNGDQVEVVADQVGTDRYVAYAVKRESDDLLAVYPHATAGRKVHYRKSLKIWLWSTMSLYAVVMIVLLIQQGFDFFTADIVEFGLLPGLGLSLLITGIMAFRVSRKLMGFVKIAETIFRTFGWPDVENIDLRKTSREERRENKLPNFGVLYFRYK
ncbi:putative type VI secretion system effector [Paraburkholderia bannensis]|uniref:putative type VI secretion system effector n=1 Tax=Paraburkholderia bannensis TaxID=765414 RepID=UPI00048465E3|nr:putative type VI secretion system effector [Paraburkholderia bannensis]